MTTNTRTILRLLAALFILASSSNCLVEAVDQAVDADGGIIDSNDSGADSVFTWVSKVKAAKSDIDEKVALDIATRIDVVLKDPVKASLVKEITTGEDHGHKARLLGGMATLLDEINKAVEKGMSEQEVVTALEELNEEFEHIEDVFKDPEKAYKELSEDGLLLDKQKADFKNNPEKLKEVTEFSILYAFLTLAHLGGLLRD